MSADVTVAVNLLWCVPGDVGGSEEYLVRQLIGLTEHAHEFRPVLYSVRGFGTAHPDLAAAFEIVEAPIDGRSRPRRVFSENFWLATRTSAAGLVHHGGGTVPGRGGQPAVLTIHDLQWQKYPEYVHPIKLAYLRRQYPRSARRARMITVPSEYVRGTVIDAYDVAPDRVLVVRHGLEPSIGRNATSESDLRKRYGLGDGPVVVLPAITHPHKRHDFILDLLAERWTDPDLKAVFTGGRGRADADVARKIEELGLSRRVVRPGRVSREDRDGLIAMAAAVVFPSEYEGFGAPALEAMTLGTPVIVSDRTALPEVVGDAGLSLPLDLDAWAGALDEVVSHRAALVAAGRQRAANFTAAHSAADLIAAYRVARS
jgi:glycosyltransferase involved in cell wall biosynthesis